ncbi:MAG: molybdopterin-dependent oxidoreductase [Candidatus Hodarchaeales archaeon]
MILPLIAIKPELTEEIPITSNDDFFTVAIDYFDIDPSTYTLQILGAVKKQLSLNLTQIKAMPVTSEIVRLSCISYKYGSKSLTGVANWTGVKLSYLLDLAKIEMSSAKDISFHTQDLTSDGYSTSLNLDEAYWDDVILAYEMNGVTLPKEHGFPLRLVCPRFWGYKWIKWISLINVTTREYKGFWERFGYEDSPFVDSELPVYYPETTIDINNSKGNPSVVFLFLATIITSTIYLGYRYFIKK